MSKAPRGFVAGSPSRSRRSVKMFVSHAHKDHVWMDRLDTVLQGFQFDDRLTRRKVKLDLGIWTDKDLAVGSPFDVQIKQELELMHIFVPLVSSHFFSSWYIQKEELPRAQKRQGNGEILVVPIRLYEMDLRERCAFLHGFPACPTDGQAWAQFGDRNSAMPLIYERLWDAIEEAMNRLRAKKP